MLTTLNPATTEPPPPPVSTGIRRLLLFVAFALVLVLVATLTPLRSYLSVGAIQSQVERVGVWGPVILLLVGVISPLFFLPRWPVAFVGGILYGLVWGSALANLASTLGAGLHFVMAATLLAPATQRLRKRYRLPAGTSMPPHRVFAILVLLRAFPFSSFVATNLIAGAWKVRPGIYLVASFIGMIPSTLMYAAWGRMVLEPSTGMALLAGGLVVALTVGGLLLSRRFAWLPDNTAREGYDT